MISSYCTFLTINVIAGVLKISLSTLEFVLLIIIDVFLIHCFSTSQTSFLIMLLTWILFRPAFFAEVNSEADNAWEDCYTIQKDLNSLVRISTDLHKALTISFSCVNAIFDMPPGQIFQKLS